jgi:hypothetical protein
MLTWGGALPNGTSALVFSVSLKFHLPSFQEGCNAPPLNGWTAAADFPSAVIPCPEERYSDLDQAH